MSMVEVIHCGEETPPSLQNFQERYLTRGEPVLFDGIASCWPACQEWCPDMFRRRFGALPVEVMAGRDEDPNYEQQCMTHKRTLTMAEYIDWIETPGAGNDGYLTANNRFFDQPAYRWLLGECRPLPVYLDPEQMNGDRTFLWLGPEGTVTPLHYDTSDVFFVQIYGRKHFRLWVKDQGEFLYNSVGVFSEVDPEQPDLARHPLYAQAQSVAIPLWPGDALFIPQGLWHYVRSVAGASISLSFTCLVR